MSKSISDNDQMIDLLKKGQAVFGISLGPVHTEAEAEIFSLYPDKVSANCCCDAVPNASC